MGKPRAPRPPDPRETSQAQTGTNVATAIANTQLGNVNQYGPTGSLEYSQTGSTSFTDPYTGQTYQIPTFSARTTLTPQQQAIFDQQQGTELGMATTANEQMDFLRNYLGENRSVPQADDAARQRIEAAMFERMSPQIEADRQRMETQLANQGIGIGSRAYSAAQDDNARAVNDARLATIMAGGQEQSRQLQMEMAARNQPINEITALLSGSQVQLPQFGMNQPTGIPTTDNAGLINANYQAQVNNVNQRNAQTSGLLGGLFGAAGNIGAAMISDERMKDNIRRVGETKEGLPIYTFTYKGDDKVQMGVMAQDVKKKNPEAVADMGNGVMGVKYGMVR